MRLSGRSPSSHGRMPTWVGHNVRDFDLRFLFHRAVMLGIQTAVQVAARCKTRQ